MNEALASAAPRPLSCVQPDGSSLVGSTADVNEGADAAVPHQKDVLVAADGPFVPLRVAPTDVIAVAGLVVTDAATPPVQEPSRSEVVSHGL